MWGKTNDVANAEQEMKEKATNKVTLEDGNLPQRASENFLAERKKFCRKGTFCGKDTFNKAYCKKVLLKN